jgi:hypothetical protein
VDDFVILLLCVVRCLGCMHRTGRQREGTATGRESKLTGRGEILIRASHFTERAPMLARSGWRSVNRPSEQCHTRTFTHWPGTTTLTGPPCSMCKGSPSCFQASMTGASSCL